MAALAAAQTTGNTAESIASAPPEIRAELDAQVAAWNHGDLKAYMQGYWHSPELTFFAGDKESAGWEAAYQRYRSAYQGKDREMGKLNFSNVRIEMLNGDAAFVRGSWQLTMRDGRRRSGLFTIVLRKFSEGWRIVHDHSS
jgi:beta-aspartyl-peptidase (threonine type)